MDQQPVPELRLEPGALRRHDLARVGDVYAGMKRYNEAADAYARAINLARAQGLKDELWPLYLLQASALEDANRWPETKQALHAAMALAPDQPLILNFLGYAKLERGEDLDAAEAMIRKASALAPKPSSSAICTALKVRFRAKPERLELPLLRIEGANVPLWRGVYMPVSFM